VRFVILCLFFVLVLFAGLRMWSEVCSHLCVLVVFFLLVFCNLCLSVGLRFVFVVLCPLDYECGVRFVILCFSFGLS
jgi:hypothetical protein